MRRVAAWTCAIAATAALAACGFIRWPLSAARVGDGLNAAFAASSNLHWRQPEAVTFAVLPWPSLHVFGARLDDAFAVNVASAPRARLDLSIGELVRGRFVATRAVLFTPVVTLDFDRPPFAAAQVGTAGAASVTGALAPISSLSLLDGVIRVVSKRRGLDTEFDDVQGRLDGLTIDGGARFDLSAVWRDQTLGIEGALAGAGRAPRPFWFTLASPVAAVAFNGALVHAAAPSVQGDLKASVSSLAALTRLFGRRPPSFLLTDDVAVDARVKATPGNLMLDDATVTSARQTLQGALDVEAGGGRPALSGTLAADRLALAPLFGAPPPLTDRAGGWSAKPFSLALLRDFDLDLRLSTGQLDLYGHRLDNAAGSVILKDGVLTANLIEATAFQGRLHGEARVACVGKDLRIRASAELADADVGAGVANFGWPGLSGRGGARFAVETSGDLPAAAVSALSGTASLDMAQGAIAGVNLEEALRRSKRRPIDIARDMRLGGTAFDRLAVELALDKGVAQVASGDMTSDGVIANLAGAVDLAGQSWNLRVMATQTDSSGKESQNAAHLTIDIGGPLSSPDVTAIGDKNGARIDDDRASPRSP